MGEGSGEGEQLRTKRQRQMRAEEWLQEEKAAVGGPAWSAV